MKHYAITPATVAAVASCSLPDLRFEMVPISADGLYHVEVDDDVAKALDDLCAATQSNIDEAIALAVSRYTAGGRLQ